MTILLLDARSKIEDMRKEAVRLKRHAQCGPDYHRYDGQVAAFARSIMCIREFELQEKSSLALAVRTLQKYAEQAKHPAKQILEDAANILIGKLSLLADINEESSEAVLETESP